MDTQAIVEREKDEIMRRIRAERETEFVQMAIVELRDKLDEKLQTAKVF